MSDGVLTNSAWGGAATYSATGSSARAVVIAAFMSLARIVSEGVRALSPGAALGLIQPSHFMDRSHRARHLVDAWLAAVSEAFEFAAEDGAAPPSSDIWAFALIALLKDCDKVSIPQINPLQLGGVCAEWHELGMNIEIRFRGVDDVYVVIEDAKGEIDSFYGRDPHLKSAATALLHLARRAL